MTRLALFGLVVFGVVVFALVVLARLPASILANFVNDSRAASAVQLTSAQGTLWRGSALASVMQADFGRIAWQVSPLSLGLDWQLENSGLSGRLKVKGETVDADLAGSLDLARLAPILSRYDISAEGGIAFNDFRIARFGEKIDIAGQVEWTGGTVDLGVGNWQGRQALPALRAEPSADSRLVVTLLDAQTNTRLPAGEIELMDDGWVKFGVTGHLASYFSQSIGNASDPSEIVLVVEERLL